MSVPQHGILMYDNPLAAGGTGNVFYKRFLAANYSHTNSAFGGFDSMSCDLLVDRYEAELIFQNKLGMRVAGFVDDPANMIWEGFINRITWRPGGVELTRSFDEMANRIMVTYTTSAGVAAQTATVNNTSSQALYGIKTGNYDADQNYQADTTQKVAISTVYLANNAYPITSQKFSGGGALLTIECLGFYWLWDWEIYTSTSAVVTDANTVFRRVTVNAAAEPPANAFEIYESSAVTGYDALIQANTSFNIARTESGGKTYLQFIRQITEAGDAANIRWTAGITPIDPNRGTRRVYYKPQSSSVEYIVRALNEPGVIRDTYGRRVMPWDVKADKVIRVSDILTGANYSSDVQDPRVAYIDSITYNAEQQSVDYQSRDDLTNDATLGGRSRYLKAGSRLKNSRIRIVV